MSFVPTSPLAKRASWRRRASLLAGAVLVPLALAEAALRIVDPGHYRLLAARERFSATILRPLPELLTSRLVPGVHTGFLGHEVVLNSRGLRNPEVALPRPSDVYRILVVGDSVPFGWGVAETECFPRRLEGLLRSVPRADGRRYEIVNASCPGWGLGDAFLYLRDEGFALAPDLVLHVLFGNDVQAAPQPVALLPAALRHSYTLRWFEGLLQKLSGQWEPDPATAIRDDKLRTALDVLAGACAPRGTPYVLLDTVDVDAPEVAEHCRKRGIPRLAVHLSAGWVAAHQIHAVDFHPDAAGHREIAERALPQLVQILNQLPR